MSSSVLIVLLSGCGNAASVVVSVVESAGEEVASEAAQRQGLRSGDDTVLGLLGLASREKGSLDGLPRFAGVGQHPLWGEGLRTRLAMPLGDGSPSFLEWAAS
jgi:hypothetical protein